MPTILRLFGFRFFFYSNEGNEPPHIHIEYGDGVAKFWLEPLVELDYSIDLKSREIAQAQRLVIENQELLKKAWHEYFG